MKKNHIFTALMVLFAAQLSFGQAVQKGNFIIDPYYGWPNLGKQFLSETIADGVTPRGIGPWGLRLEYLVGDRFGITLDGIHNSAGAEYRETPDFITNDNGVSVPNNQEFTYRAMMNRLRIQLGFNYHFDFNDDNLDAYFGVAAGTNNRFWSVSTNEPNSNFADEATSGTLLPFSARIRFGGRYYFNDVIGANLELGLGGPLISAGLSFRF
ncbi:MAG: hypothetical protein JJT77_10780 [Crocinitomicaceae bacterium]|nr:hypothetical protein [Crocinitomicaceae bacterium]